MKGPSREVARRRRWRAAAHHLAAARGDREALQRSEERLRLALQAANQGLYDLDLRTGRAQVSPEYATMLGYDPDAFRETHERWKDRLHPDDRAPVEAAFRAYVRGEIPDYAVEFRQQTRSGGWKWIWSVGRIVAWDAAGEPTRLLGTHTDITARKTSEERLRRSESLLRESQRVARLGHYVFDARTGSWESSETLDRVFGIGPEFEKTVEGWHRLIHPDDREEMARYLAEHVLTEGRRFDREYRIQRASDGREAWVHGLGDLRLDADGNPVEMFGTIQDVTARKRAELALEESQRRLNTLAEATFEGVAVVRRGVFVDLNHQLARMLGYGRSELLGTPMLRCVAPEHRERAEASAASESLEPQEYLALRKDGTEFPVEVRSRTTEIAGDDVRVSVIRDVTERKAAETALRKFQFCTDHSPEGVFWIDREGRLMYANDQACRSLGYSRAELIGLALWDIDPIYPRERWAVTWAERSATPRRHETLHRRRDGVVVPVEIVAHHVWFGDAEFHVAYARDITERRQSEEELARHRTHLEELVAERTRELSEAQEELVRRERLAVLGQLTATVSHELRNPLGVMSSSAFYLRRRLADADEKTLKHLERIDQQVRICDAIVGDLLEYTRGRHVERSPGDFNAWLRGLLEDLALTEGTTPTVDLAADLPEVAFDREKVRRVVVNLVTNGRQALAARLEAARRDGLAYEPTLRVRTRPGPGEVVLEVEDNGAGMDADTRRRALEPLFTTRARGTGLGLAIVERVVAEHGGTIGLESRPGEGTTVTVGLPTGPASGNTSGAGTDGNRRQKGGASEDRP